MKRFGAGALCLALLFFNGCKPNQKLLDEIEDLKKRVAALEKMLQPPKEELQVQTSAYDVPVGTSAVLGKKNAPVSIVVFSNYQCQYCAKADKALREAIKDDMLKNTTNLVFKHFPFDRHVHARAAAHASLAAGDQGKFWEMSDLIFENQTKMREGSFEATKTFEEWAKKIGLDVAKFKADLKEKEKAYNDIIDADITLGEKAAKLEGTPWILVNGWLLDGDISAATIKKMIIEKKLAPIDTPS